MYSVLSEILVHGITDEQNHLTCCTLFLTGNVHLVTDFEAADSGISNARR